MKNNQDLQSDVQNAIKWEPLLHAQTIGVTVQDGVVSLTGVVDSYPKKIEAENAAKKVIGVKTVIQNIEVKFPNDWNKLNGDVENEVLLALRANLSVPNEKVTVKVLDGWVTLEGELTWNYQKEAANNTVHYLSGVKGVTNNITIKSESNDVIEQKAVADAIARSWSVDNNDIQVSVSGTTVTLYGIVSSWFQKEEAERIAWKTPSIWHVNNELVVDHYYEYAI